jgi:hypothetical protein
VIAERRLCHLPSRFHRRKKTGMSMPSSSTGPTTTTCAVTAQGTTTTSMGCSPTSQCGSFQIGGRTELVFAAKLLQCLRAGSSPSPAALEWSGFVEHWAIIVRDDVCLLTGSVWRLPLRRHSLAAPLLAIDPAAGWARALDEWLTIEMPCGGVAGPCPDLVAERAARWLEQQLHPVQ